MIVFECSVDTRSVAVHPSVSIQPVDVPICCALPARRSESVSLLIIIDVKLTGSRTAPLARATR